MNTLQEPQQGMSSILAENQVEIKETRKAATRERTIHELLGAAKQQANASVSEARFALLNALKGLEEYGFEDNYGQSLLHILEENGPTHLADLKLIMPDSTRLTATRSALKGKIHESPDATTKILRLKTQAEMQADSAKAAVGQA